MRNTLITPMTTANRRRLEAANATRRDDANGDLA
jgi:hypothetical protein